MSEMLKWDQTGERYFETGVDRGVFYPYESKTKKYGKGVAWNGLTGVTESPEGAEETEFWADNMKYAGIRSAETFGATIEAYTYPKEFEACDGTATVTDGMKIGQQKREMFGFSYRTRKQNDMNAVDDDSYLIHLIYGAFASPSEKAYETINDSPDAITFSWELTTNPVEVTGHRPTSYVVLDSAALKAAKEDGSVLTKVEEKLYGGGSGDGPTLPTPDELKELIDSAKGQ